MEENQTQYRAALQMMKEHEATAKANVRVRFILHSYAHF